MKKLFSIIFAVMILLSGMNLSLATHLCGGEVSAVKVSLIHEKAGCAMCAADTKVPAGKRLTAEGCCKDEFTNYAVDQNYCPSAFQINKPVNQILSAYIVPSAFRLPSLYNAFLSYTHVRPPGKYLVTAVSLPDICVFLI